MKLLRYTAIFGTHHETEKANKVRDVKSYAQLPVYNEINRRFCRSGGGVRARGKRIKEIYGVNKWIEK